MRDPIRSPDEPQRGSAPAAFPVVLAAVGLLAFAGMMVAGMAWMGGDHGGMMRRGSSGADQTPVVSDSGQVTVEMRNYEFFPAALTVNAGTEITWVNRDSVPHNAVADDAFDSGKLDAGDDVSLVMEQPGSYPYVCTYHPGMEGTLTVR